MASVDYDPRKAHEYYEKHKKLKGKNKKSANTQTEQLSYVQAQLRDQQKKSNAEAREKINSNKAERLNDIREAKQRQKEQITAQTKQKVEQLKTKYKNATPEQKEAMREQISNTIYNLQETSQAKKNSIDAKAAKESEKVNKKASADSKAATEENKKIYKSEVEKAKKRIKSGK